MRRIAIVGAGIGTKHLEACMDLGDRIEVAALCDLDLERARSAVAAWPGTPVTDDLGGLLEDPSIDLIDICLPPHLHLRVAEQALAAGKHVICEKPLTCSLAEADRLATAADQAGRRVYPVFQYRFGRAMTELRALIAAGLAGRPLVASLETHWNRGADYYAVPWRGTWAREAGGAVLGHAIHAHDLLTCLFGPVEEVTALTDTRVNPIETEDCAAIVFRMANGALATSSVTLGAADDTTRLRFCFDGFTAESGCRPYAPMEGAWQFTARHPRQQSEIDAVLSGVGVGFVGFAGFLDAVLADLDGHRSSAVSLADGRRSIELVTAIYRSTRTGQPVRMPIGRLASDYTGWQPERRP